MFNLYPDRHVKIVRKPETKVVATKKLSVKELTLVAISANVVVCADKDGKSTVPPNVVMLGRIALRKGQWLGGSGNDLRI